MFSYEELLSGDPLVIKSVCKLKHPTLGEIVKPATGIGTQAYNMFLQLLRADPPTILKFIYGEDADINNVANAYELVSENETMRSLYREALDFFISDVVVFAPSTMTYRIVERPSEEDLKNPEYQIHEVGQIDKGNFDMVRSAILEMNHIPPEETDIVLEFASPAAEIAYWKVKEWESKLKPIEDNKESWITFGNMISKLCCPPSQYTYFNIYDLPIYVFYDTFYQMVHMRSRQFTESLVATFGSDKKNPFDYNEWLKPIQ